jgi:hypothetical protein
MDAEVAALRDKHYQIREISLAIDRCLEAPRQSVVLGGLLDRLDTDVTVYLTLQQLVLFPRLKSRARALTLLLHERSSIRRLQQRLRDEVLVGAAQESDTTIVTLLGLLLVLLEKEERWLACMGMPETPSAPATALADWTASHRTAMPSSQPARRFATCVTPVTS